MGVVGVREIWWVWGTLPSAIEWDCQILWNDNHVGTSSRIKHTDQEFHGSGYWCYVMVSSVWENVWNTRGAYIAQPSSQCSVLSSVTGPSQGWTALYPPPITHNRQLSLSQGKGGGGAVV